MSAGFTPVFRCPRRAACDERALVLLALAIPHVIEPEADGFMLCVDAEDAARALAHLRSYELERERERLERERSQTLPPVALSLRRHAWVGCAIYALVLLAVALMIGSGVGRLDAFDRGALDGAGIQSGQWWRAWTALTLHLDGAHLVANLGAGCWFGYLAGRVLGGGTAWLLTVTGAAAANLLEGELGPAAHSAVGASTAVFTALGLLAAYSWRRRAHLPQRWASRWSPLVAGCVLLGWFGSSGENTDLVGHALGFAFGAVLGVIAALPTVERLLQRLPQWIAGAAALASIVIAWAFALGR